MGCILITQMMWVFFSADKCSHLLPGTFTIIKIICCTWLSKQWQRPLWAQTLGLDNRSTSPPLCRCRHLFCLCYKGLLWSWPFFLYKIIKDMSLWSRLEENLGRTLTPGTAAIPWLVQTHGQRRCCDLVLCICKTHSVWEGNLRAIRWGDLKDPCEMKAKNKPRRRQRYSCGAAPRWHRQIEMFSSRAGSRG